MQVQMGPLAILDRDLSEIPEALKNELLPWAKTSLGTYGNGQFLLQECSAKEFTITQLSIDAAEESYIRTHSPDPAATFLVMLKKSVSIQLTGQKRIHLEQGNIMLLPNGPQDLTLHYQAGKMTIWFIETQSGFREEMQDILRDSRAWELGDDTSVLPMAGVEWRMMHAIDKIRDCNEMVMISRLVFKCAILDLAILYLQAIKEHDTASESGVPNAELYKRIRQHILTAPHIHRHSVMQLARRFGVGPGTLNRNFRILFGHAPASFVRNQVMEKAKHLLLSTNLPIEEVAYELGYTESNNFYPAFKNRFGISPTEMRRLNSKVN